MKIKVSGLKRLEGSFSSRSKKLKNIAKEADDVAAATPISSNEIKKVIVAPDDKTALLEAIIRNDHVEQAKSLLQNQHHMSLANIEAEVAKISAKRRKDEIVDDKRKRIKDKISKGTK